jgi:hypothetical protein
MKFSHVVSNKDLSSIVINVANYFLETEKTYSMLKNGNEFALKLQWKSCFSNDSEFISVLCLNNLCSKLMNEAMDDLFELNIFFPECFKTNLDLTNGCLTISIRLIFDNDFDEYVLNKIHALGFKNMEIAL